MTIKELAEFTGKNRTTIGRWIEKLGELEMLNELQNATSSKPVDFNIDEVERILKAGSMSKDAVSILINNARDNNKKALAEIDNNNPMVVMMNYLSKMQEQQQLFMTKVLSELDSRSFVKNEVLQLEHVPEKSTRAMFRQSIGKLVELSKTDFSTCYNMVYSEMGYVYNVKVKARANNRGVKPIDVLETDGLMGKAIAITRQMIEQKEKGVL